MTRENGTEPEFQYDYRNNNEEGIYVSIITGKPIFSTPGKYDSGCGWPSFVKPIGDDGHIFSLVLLGACLLSQG